MRQALLSGRQQQAAGRLDLVPTPAPVKGWNTRDPVSQLNPLYAQILENLYPTEGAVGLRGGSESWATGTTGTVKTVFSFQPNNSANAKLFAVSDAGIYDITAGGAVGAVVKALTNGLLETINITNSAGTNYIWGCNGVDKVVVSSDGTTWTSLDGTSSPAITGVTTTDLNWCFLAKRRIFAIIKQSMKFCFLPIDSIAGVASTMNLGALFKRGGYLISGATWTMDAGSGPDDYVVFLTSEGEVAIYQGINPASATSWSLVGVFFAGRPASRRCFENYGADLLVNTEMGLLSIGRLVAAKLFQPQEALSDAIRPSFEAAHRLYRTNNGWQTVTFGPQNAVITNIPISTNQSLQYVMNGVTGAWCSFGDWDATCFCSFNGALYFGTSTTVRKAWDGNIVGDATLDVVGTAFLAPRKFTGARQSQIAMMRPLIQTDGSVEIGLGVVSDFDRPEITSVLPRMAIVGAALWDIALWDVGLWSGGQVLLRSWNNVSCDPGTYLAPYLQLSSNDATIAALTGIDYQVKAAGWM